MKVVLIDNATNEEYRIGVSEDAYGWFADLINDYNNLYEDLTGTKVIDIIAKERIFKESEVIG